ncbi:MAG: tryptophan 7-halogenase [Steroidobacteraceae bacterium]|nr:tryptophan 7-halogenase [Steroidobacteraceae bacterium]
MSSVAGKAVESIRDFIILHQPVILRQDSPFWRACRGAWTFPPRGATASVSSPRLAASFRRERTIRRKLADSGYVGSGNRAAPARNFLDGIKSHVEKTVAQLPPHQAYVEQYCKAPPGSGAMG